MENTFIIGTFEHFFMTNPKRSVNAESLEFVTRNGLSKYLPDGMLGEEGFVIRDTFGSLRFIFAEHHSDIAFNEMPVIGDYVCLRCRKVFNRRGDMRLYFKAGSFEVIGAKDAESPKELRDRWIQEHTAYTFSVSDVMMMEKLARDSTDIQIEINARRRPC